MKSNFTPPRIESVSADGRRPLWSVMIPTFNCAKYLRETLESVLAQDPGPDQMQIEVVDDYSEKDDPEAVVREIGKGRVMFYRKPKNEGVTPNFNTCIQRSRGHLVHILHGDDYVLPGFYSEILRLRTVAPDANLFGCRHFGVDENGVIWWVSPCIGELESGGRSAAPFYYNSALQFCGVVIRRDFYDQYGGFLTALVHTADCEMWARAISQGGGIVSNKVLSHYRNFSANDTSRLKRTGENIRDLMRLNAIFAGTFSDYSYSKGQARSALMARSQAEYFAKTGDIEASKENWRLWRELAPIKIRIREIAKQAFQRL